MSLYPSLTSKIGKFHILKESSYDLTEYATKSASNSSKFNRYNYCKLLSHILDCKAIPKEINYALSKMDSLTPGDFAAVARKFKVLSKIPSQAELLKALEEELMMKDNNKSRLGF